MAVVLQDLQYLDDTIQIQMIDPFIELTMYIGNWHIDIPEGTDFNDPSVWEPSGTLILAEDQGRGPQPDQSLCGTAE